jgi:hypothetical protein
MVVCGAPSSQSCVSGLLLLLRLISSSDADKRIVKAVDKFLDFVSNMHKNTAEQRSVESYFKK